VIQKEKVHNVFVFKREINSILKLQVQDGLADNLIGSFIHQFDLFLHSNFLSIKILNSLKD